VEFGVAWEFEVVVRVVRSVGGGQEGVNFTLWFGGLKLSYRGGSEGLDCCALGGV
jgi:hypothetical protein